MRRLLETLFTLTVVGSIAVMVILARSGGPSAEGRPASNESASANVHPGGGATTVQTKPPVVVAPADPVALAPVVPPKELTGECFNHVTSVDGMPPTIAMMTPGASLVALGTVTEIGPAQWNTPGGIPPAEDDLDVFHVMRLVRVSVDRAITGAAQGPVTTWINGGKIGCHGFYGDTAPDLSVGDRFALFFDETPPATGLKGVLHSRAIWPISSDNKIASPGDGAIAVDVFASKVAVSMP